MTLPFLTNLLIPQLIEEKAKLLEKSKELVDKIKENNLEKESELRSLYHKLEGELESEKKAFKQGSDERFQKVNLNPTPHSFPL